MLNQQKTYGLRKAKNMTTLVGCEVGVSAMRKLIVGAALMGAVAFSGALGNRVSADELSTNDSIIRRVDLPNGHFIMTEPYAISSRGVARNDGVEPVAQATPHQVSANSADVVTTENPNPATNLEAPQPLPTNGNFQSSKASETTEGSLVSTVETDGLVDAVQQAQDAGLPTTQGKHQSASDYFSALGNQNSQANQIRAITKEYQDASSAAVAANREVDGVIKQAQDAGLSLKTTTKEITKASEADTSELSKQKAVISQYQNTTNAVEDINDDVTKLITDLKEAGARVTTLTKKVSSSKQIDHEQVAQIQKELDEFKVQLAYYKEKLNQFNRKKIEYDKLMEQYLRAKALYDEQVRQAQANATKKGYLPQVVNQNLVWATEENAQIASVSHSSGMNVITSSSSASDISEVGRTYTALTGQTGFASRYEDIVRKGGAATVLKVGESISVRFNNLQNSRIGSTKIASVQAVYTLTKKEANPLAPNSDEALFVVYQDPTNGARTSVSGGKVEYDVFLTYYDESGKEISLQDKSIVLGLSSLNHADTYIYNHLYDSFEYVSQVGTNGTLLQINDSSVTIQPDGRAYSLKNNEYKGVAGVNKNGQTEYPNWDDVTSPDFWYGATAMQYYHPSSNTLKVVVGAEQREEYWFTINSNVATSSVVEEPVAPEEPKIGFVEPKVLEVTLTQYEVNKPVIEVTKYQVDKPSVSYHYHTLSQAPKIIKQVESSDGVDVNSKMVPKNSENKYPLILPTIKAGRPSYKQDEVVIEDYLPSGFKFEQTKTVAANPDYVITFDEVTNHIKATFSETGLAKLNHDLTKDFDLIDLVLFGSPQNDNGVYKNTYSLLIGDYKVYSNTVTIYTPGGDNPGNGGSTIQPVKQVQDLAGKDLNNQALKQGQSIVYVGEWDMDQYKVIVAGAVAIQKGFGYIDNYDETKVILDMENVTIKDSDGKIVEGLTAYVVKNLEDAPEVIKELVRKASIQIAPNDEFVIWVADKPQVFYDTYVKNGLDIFLTIPAKVKLDVPSESKIENVMYQIDFGNGYVSNVVTNYVPAPVVPESPKPTPPVESVKTLPSTGVTESSMGLIGAALLIILGFVGLKRKEEK